MAVSPPPTSYELSEYGRVLRRRWWIVLVATLIGIAAGAAYVSVAQKSYTGTVLVQVNAVPNGASASVGTVNAAGGRTNSTVNMDNEAQLVQSMTVAALANKKFHSSLSLPDLVKETSVAVPANTTFLQIGCRTSTAASSATCANDFGSAYLSNRYTTAVAAVTHSQAILGSKITAVSKQIDSLKALIAKYPSNAPQAIAPTVTLNADEVTVHSLEGQLNQATVILAGLTPASVGSIASPATPPTAPTSPRLLLFLPSGLLAGLIIGLVLAFLVDRRDDHVHTSRDVERRVGLPVLLNSVPLRAGLNKELAPAASRAGQAFAQLAQSVATSFGDGDHVLLVAGTSAGNGNSVVAANLAATLARTRSDVVLVCANRRRSLTTQLLGIGDGPGLSELLAGSASVSEVAQRPTMVPRLRVISPGYDTSDTLPDPHDAAARLMAELTAQARYVVVEVQSVAEDAASFTLSEFADGALVTIEIARTRLPEALECTRSLDRVRVPVLGAAVLPKSRGAQTRQPSGPARAPTGPGGGLGRKVSDKPVAAVGASTGVPAAKADNGAVPTASGVTSTPATVAPQPRQS
jgi:capsular polysaccharide biosynthesis protein/Mrp family chromosome partitioning ATPase